MFLRAARAGPALFVATLLGAVVAPAAAADIVVRPATPRLGDPVALSLSGVDPASDYDGYANVRGRPCARDQSPWRIGVVDPAIVPVSFDPDDRFTPITRSVRLCAYTMARQEDGSSPIRTLLAERLLTLPFRLTPGVAPVSISDGRGDGIALRWSPTSASIRKFIFSCARKRFALTVRTPVSDAWTFEASGVARADNSSNYDVPIPPRYGGRATLRIAGGITPAGRGSLRLVVKVRFRAPGLPPTRGVPRCLQGDRVFRTTFL